MSALMGEQCCEFGVGDGAIEDDGRLAAESAFRRVIVADEEMLQVLPAAVGQRPQGPICQKLVLPPDPFLVHGWEDAYGERSCRSEQRFCGSPFAEQRRDFLPGNRMKLPHIASRFACGKP